MFFRLASVDMALASGGACIAMLVLLLLPPLPWQHHAPYDAAASKFARAACDSHLCDARAAKKGHRVDAPPLPADSKIAETDPS